MDIGVEISLYPLKADFVPAIHEFLERLSRASRSAGGDEQHEHAGIRAVRRR